MKLGLAALLLTGCAAAPTLVEAPRSSEAALVAPILLAVEEPRPPTRDELLDTCERLAAFTCNDVPEYDPTCITAVILTRGIAARCYELAE